MPRAGLGVGTFQNGFLPPDVNKVLHSLFMLGAIICSLIGLTAVWKSINDDARSNLSTLHSWIGLIAVILLAQNYIIGAFCFLFKVFPTGVSESYIHIHKSLGLFTLISAVLAICTGIQFITYGCENYATDGKDSNPAENYHNMSDGCKLANGVGLVVFWGLFLVLYSIRVKDDAVANLSLQQKAAAIDLILT